MLILYFCELNRNVVKNARRSEPKKRLSLIALSIRLSKPIKSCPVVAYVRKGKGRMPEGESEQKNWEEKRKRASGFCEGKKMKLRRGHFKPFSSVRDEFLKIRKQKTF